jgi:predicted ABC-type ATPase
VPVLTVVAGPYGSGKSSVIGTLEYEGRENLLDPDAVAKRINPSDPSRAAVTAAREVIGRAREYLESRQSFVIETTLSSGGTLGTMREARRNGFIVHLVYICLDTTERNIRRVRERVERGGHDVPEKDVRRRYERSLLNLPAARNARGRRRLAYRPRTRLGNARATGDFSYFDDIAVAPLGRMKRGRLSRALSTAVSAADS